MCDEKEEEDIPQDGSLQEFQSYLFEQEQVVQNRQQPMQLDQGSHGYYEGRGVGDHERGTGLQFQEPTASPILPWPLPPPIQSSFNPVHLFSNLAGYRDGHFFEQPSSSYGHGAARFGRRPSGLQLAYEAAATDHLGVGGLYISEQLGLAGRASSSPFTFQSELSQMTAQEIMDAKALAASKSHSEAERRRRERINNHLARLRSLLPSTTKTDKASLLAEVIQHVKDLKRQTSEISDQFEPLPTEVDELTVDHADENGKVVIRASLCCEDRSDLLPDLIKTLKALRLRPLKAEITTLGGRVKNVLLITGEDDSASADLLHSISSIQEALKAVIEKTSSEEPSSGSMKRQRTNTNISMLERRSV